MAAISDTTPLLEVLFGLNLSAPALFRVMENSRAAVTNAVADAAMSMDPALRVSDTDRLSLRRTVVLFYPWLRRAFKAASGLVIVSIAAAGLCFAGLVLSALRPGTPIPDAAVTVWASIGLILPLSYVALRRHLDWAQEKLIGHIEHDTRHREVVGSYFRDFIQRQKSWDASSKAFDDAVASFEAIKRARGEFL
jgi:hypothetical protein